MARIRTVKPVLFRHTDLFKAEQSSGLPLRLVFIGLFTCADREGRFRWRPQELKLDVLPYDEVNLDEALTALARYGFILKYRVGHEYFGCIPTWHQHQCINKRESVSQLPAPPQREVNPALLEAEWVEQADERTLNQVALKLQKNAPSPNQKNHPSQKHSAGEGNLTHSQTDEPYHRKQVEQQTISPAMSSTSPDELFSTKNHPPSSITKKTYPEGVASCTEEIAPTAMASKLPLDLTEASAEAPEKTCETQHTPVNPPVANEVGRRLPDQSVNTKNNGLDTECVMNHKGKTEFLKNTPATKPPRHVYTNPSAKQAGELALARARQLLGMTTKVTQPSEPEGLEQSTVAAYSSELNADNPMSTPPPCQESCSFLP